jgi:DDB1- and CUL4-associated factor 13
MNNGTLPHHSPSRSSAIEEKRHLVNANTQAHGWFRLVHVHIPGVRNRRLRLILPNFGPFNQLRMARVRRSRGPLLVCLACMAFFITVMLVSRKDSSTNNWSPDNWPTSIDDASTLVFKREDLQRIWKWEIASGHFPSRQPSTWLIFTFHCDMSLRTLHIQYLNKSS